MERALRLLEQFTGRTPEWGLTELAGRLGISKSMTHRLLSTLMDRGFVVQNPHTRRYHLGLRLLGLGAVVSENLRIRQVALPYMQELAQRCQEAVFLTVREGSDAILVAQVELRQSVNWLLGIGERSPLNAGASNKVLLAFLPPAEQEALLTEKGPAAPGRAGAAGAEELRQIREQGWAFSAGEVTPQSAAVAVPILSQRREVLGSLAIAGPEGRFPPERIPELVLAAQESALAIASHYRDGTGPVG